MTQFFDLRAERSPKPVRGIRKIKTDSHGDAVIRQPKDIDTIVVHQTACDFAPPRGMPRAMRYRRALDVACHALAFKTGEAVLATPLVWHVNHGNGYNARSLGLEIEGHYRGIPGQRTKTPRDDLDVFTLETARKALAYLVGMARAEGMPIKYVRAHRQSSATRRDDPGFEIWQGLRPTFHELGLLRDPDEALSAGRPIPVAWDPTASAAY